jgi:hypothetical protein
MRIPWGGMVAEYQKNGNYCPDLKMNRLLLYKYKGIEYFMKGTNSWLRKRMLKNRHAS